MHKEKELAHHLCEITRQSLLALITKTVPGSFLVGSYVLQKSGLVSFQDAYVPLIVFVRTEESALRLSCAFPEQQFVRENHTGEQFFHHHFYRKNKTVSFAHYFLSTAS